MADRQTGRNSDQFNLRLPEGMRDKIAIVAQESGRSMNAEIVQRLKSSLPNGDNQTCTVEFERTLWREIFQQSELAETTPERLIAGIVEDTLRGMTPDHSYPLQASEGILRTSSDLSGEVTDLRLMIKVLEEEIETYFISYYNKILQMKLLTDIITKHDKDRIPEDVLKISDNIRDISETELNLSKKRNIELILQLREPKDDTNEKK